MLNVLLAGYGHAPDAAGKAKQKPLDVTGSSYADRQLLPAIVLTGKFLDQELYFPG